ncbi:MAG: hypothetical protein SGPRY_010353, partial [Prymnesium sp.]
MLVRTHGAALSPCLGASARRQLASLRLPSALPAFQPPSCSIARSAPSPFSSLAGKLHRGLCARTIEAAAPPPFVVRAALVGVSAGLATPLYVVGGVLIAWYRFLPQSKLGQMSRVGISTLIGGGVMTLTWHHVIPFLSNHADLLLPFSLATGLSATFWYSILEQILGLKAMAGRMVVQDLMRSLPSPLARWGGGMHFTMHLPVGGIAVGLATGLTAQFLWPACIHLCWPAELRSLVLGERGDASHLVDLYLHIVLPVGLPVSVAAGYGLQVLLREVLLPTSGVAWTSRALPLLLSLLSVGTAYFGWCRPAVNDLFWEERISVSTGEHYSANVRTGEVSHGVLAAQSAAESRAILIAIRAIEQPLFTRLQRFARAAIWDEVEDMEARLPPAPCKYDPSAVEPSLGLIHLDEHVSLSHLISLWRADLCMPARKCLAVLTALTTQARMFLLVDLLAIGQRLSACDTPQAKLQLEGMERLARSRLGVELSPLLVELRAAVALTRRSRRLASHADDVSFCGQREEARSMLRKVCERAEMTCVSMSSGPTVDLIQLMFTNLDAFEQAAGFVKDTVYDGNDLQRETMLDRDLDNYLRMRKLEERQRKVTSALYA